MKRDQYTSNLSVAAVSALGISVLWFLLTWRYDLNLADEGFYWYGVQRVSAGEVPLRDFMSYDIGRYYWGAAFMQVLGQDGLFAVRLGAAVYQALGTLIGVYISLLALQRDGIVRWLFAISVASLLTLWVNPYFKVYDSATSIMIVGICVVLLKTTDPRAWLVAGVCLGLAAMVGRNHGVYGAAASLLIFLLLLRNAKAPQYLMLRLYARFALGVFIGFSPTFFMMIGIEGFFSAFLDSILEMFEYGATNIPLPVPWPWTVPIGQAAFLQNVAIGVGFLFILAFPAVGIFLVGVRRFDLDNDSRVVLAAATACAIPYAHYAFARADLNHLLVGSIPAILGLLTAAGYMKGLRPLVLSTIVLGVALIMVPKSLFLHHISHRPYVLTDVGGEKLWLGREFSEAYGRIMKPLEGLARNDERFLALPNLPSLHAISRTKMATWEIYALFPVDQDSEAREIARIESMLPDLILLSDHALDGNPALRFSRTRPLTYRWITTHYEMSDLIQVGELRSYLRRQ
jgi:hypothetical protein